MRRIMTAGLGIVAILAIGQTLSPVSGAPTRAVGPNRTAPALRRKARHPNFLPTPPGCSSNGTSAAVLAGTYNEACDADSAVGGGHGNVVGGDGTSSNESFIAGGFENAIEISDHSVVAGGYFNTVSYAAPYAMNHDSGIVTGQINQVGSPFSLIGAGVNNTIVAASAVTPPDQNGQSAFIGAGENNSDGANFASIVGGASNTLGSSAAETGDYGFIGGGYGNSLTAEYGALVAGYNNSASGVSSFVGAGSQAQASGTASAVVAGQGNIASGDESFIGGGASNTVQGAQYGSVTAGQGNRVVAASSTIGGGQYNTIAATAAFIGAGHTNVITSFTGTTCGSPCAGGFYGVIGGGSGNSLGAANGGGEYGTIGGGASNVLTGPYDVIAGGADDAAAGAFAAVGGGQYNTASGHGATVPGGYRNVASGVASFAAGYGSLAQTDGSFVWSDHAAGARPLASTRADEFLVRAGGGIVFYTSAALTSGASLAPGSGSWSNLSDRSMKTSVQPLDDATVLAKVGALPVSEWSYRTEPGVHHIGPMAQDFYAAFRVGEDDRHITTIDEDGVALSAIKGLYDDARRKDARIAALQRENGRIERELHAMAARIAALGRSTR
jgi:hypothetical protein